MLWVSQAAWEDSVGLYPCILPCTQQMSGAQGYQKIGQTLGSALSPTIPCLIHL